VDDRLYCLVFQVFQREKVQKCECYVFSPRPFLIAGATRPLHVAKLPTTITEDLAFPSEEGANPSNDDGAEGSPDELSDGDTGFAPEILVPVTVDHLSIQLVCSNNNASNIIGFLVVIDSVVVTKRRLYEPLKLGHSSADDLKLRCYQISGHLANDNKQINILTGQGSCSVSYPMPCCLVHKSNLGQPPEWLQRRYLRALVSAPSEWEDSIIELIGAFLGKPLVKDPRKREGEFCFQKTHAKWHQLTAGGRLTLNANDHKRANDLFGSSFKKPLFLFQGCKQNAGFMHTPSGHITHFWVSVSNAIRERMSEGDWRKRLSTIDEKVKVMITTIEKRLKDDDAMAASSKTRKKISRIRNNLTRCEKKVMVESDAVRKSALVTLAEKLRRDEEEALKEMVDHAKDSDLGDYYQLLGGLREFLEALKGIHSSESKRAQSDLEYALWKCVESRAGGKLNPKNSGMEQTNGKGMISLQNCIRGTEALRGMYPEDDEIGEWLIKETMKWEALAAAIFDVGCFLKSQQKRCPRICDDKLFVLWYRWEDAFPGKKFNKFHGMFCTIRDFVHLYEMTGRVSEESTSLSMLHSRRSRIASKQCQAIRRE
jgi:hypothetical protein